MTVLEDHLIHQCLDIILEPSKQAARLGVMLSDPIGLSHYCFTPLASYIPDTPEAMMLASGGGKTLPVTMAMYKQFGDYFRHKPQTKSTTLPQLTVVKSCADPNDVKAFFHEAQKFRLNGIEKLFWCDWVLVEPSHFFTPESLHHIHKQFYDHDAKWLICAVGERNLEAEASHRVLSTGHQTYIIAVSEDAVPTGILTALPCIDEEDIKHISDSLAEFHANKDMIIAAGVRRGKGNRVINNWWIPKLELMQSIVTSIYNSGVIGQWSANVTEHAHITEVKDPTRSSNNNNYDPQIC
ncbi:hypothetical protein P692DRAFT_20872467 [Suillus brevipes Sb2]|nr:hypothetical protein P692DRAFT_20872467 [Suillus brevipes Sb2]